MFQREDRHSSLSDAASASWINVASLKLVSFNRHLTHLSFLPQSGFTNSHFAGFDAKTERTPPVSQAFRTPCFRKSVRYPTRPLHCSEHGRTDLSLTHMQFSSIGLIDRYFRSTRNDVIALSQLLNPMPESHQLKLHYIRHAQLESKKAHPWSLSPLGAPNP